MDVALVYPEAVDLARFKEGRKEFPPFGVLYLAAILESNGINVTVFKLTPDEFQFDFLSFDAVCFSVASSATFDLFKICREFSYFATSKQVLLAGGVHAHFFPEQTLRELNVDAVCYAEADHIIADLVSFREQNRELSSIPNLVFFNAEGVIERTSKSPPQKYLDALPEPARHLFPTDDVVMSDRLAGTDTKMAHVMFTRGCPFSCEYCAVAQTKMQYRLGASCRGELESLVDRYGIGGFAIVDDNFIVNKKIVLDICEQIEPLGLSWSALSRVDVVTSPLLRAMRSSGCLEIKYGVESGDEGLLRHMSKNTTVDQIESALRATSEAGIRNKVFIVHGFPGENLKTTEQTIRLLERNASLISRVSVFPFVPLPGSGSFNQWQRFGVHGTNFENGWDGRWSKFHIHHNDHHWWGDIKDFSELQQAHKLLTDFVDSVWTERHAENA